MNNFDKVASLQAAVAAAAPIVSVAVGKIGDSATVVVTYDPAATAPQQAAAQTVINGFDWSDAAQAARADAAEPDLTAIKSAAAAAVTANLSFLAIGAPTAPQTLAQVQALTQQMNRVIKALIREIAR